MASILMGVLACGHEIQTSSHYRWNNSQRGGTPHIIVQLTLKGFCRFRVGDKVSDVRPGQAFIAAVPEDSEYWYPEGVGEPYELDFISLSGTYTRELTELLRERYGSVISFGEQSEALLLFREIQRHFKDASFRDRFHQSDLVNRFIMALFREHVQRVEQRDPVAFCYNYLHDHHRTNFNIKRLAAEAGISREHLTREFVRRYGQSPAALLRSLRLQTARNLLAASHQTLDQIARASGLTSARNLSRLFLQELGITPEAYRRASL